MDLFCIEQKHIAITGASSGFGHHFAGLLGARGARVSLGARRKQKLEARVAEIESAGGAAFACPLDVTSAEDIESFLDAAESTYGPIDVLINNAGVEPGPKTFMDIDEDDWDTVLDTNLKSAWMTSQAYTRRVAARDDRRGNIVNISSITATRAIKGQFPYAISKAGLSRMTEILALEAPKFGIRANAIAPGYILTDISRTLLEGEYADAYMNRIPMRRYGTFEDLDGPLLLLVSDASRYMNGAVITVDGGHVCASL